MRSYWNSYLIHSRFTKSWIQGSLEASDLQQQHSPGGGCLDTAGLRDKSSYQRPECFVVNPKAFNNVWILSNVF